MEIKKKIWPKYFQLIKEGKKTYELRLADWECKEGDFLLLKEWDPNIKDFTGRILKKEITYVGKTKGIDFFSKEEIEKYGFQIISFK